MKRKLPLIFSSLAYLLCMVNSLHAKTWYVGQNETYQYCSQLSSLVQDYDTIYIKSGQYINDKQVTWTANHLTIIGIGLPELIAGNTIAQDMNNGKGIFVTKGNDILIENVAFMNAKVVDNNGAGIRQEGCNLIIRHCLFENNEMGILCGSIPHCKTTIEYCTFSQNGSSDNPGYQHNVYINHIDTLIFRYNVSKNATAEGHELKSRASFNLIAYNSIANIDSEDSRTIDLPNGGTSIIIGNVITQGPLSANSNIIGYGLEGLSNATPHILALANNTIVNFKSNGSFIHIPESGVDSLILYNNIFGGKFSSKVILGNAAATIDKGNYMDQDITKLFFADVQNFDFMLASQSPCINEGFDHDHFINGYSLRPTKEFVNGESKDRIQDNHIDCGAYEKISTSTLQLDHHFRAFPNPFNDHLDIEYPFPLNIYNAMGQSMARWTKGTIDTHNWAPGVYILKGEKINIKVMKQ